MNLLIIPLHWWYVPLLFVCFAGYFYWRLEYRHSDTWSDELFDFIAMTCCLFIAVVCGLVGWWAS